MIYDIWITYIVIVVMFLFLLTNLYSAEVIILTAILGLLWTGVISFSEAFSGFTSEGVLTIASLFIIMNTIQQHPSFSKITSVLFGKMKTHINGMTRMMVVTGALSSFMNNTPLVVLFTPIVKKWANKYSIFPSKLLIPLSYAAIIGGMCTLIGTSTNLVIHTLLQKEGFEGFTLFELAYVGVPFFIIALIYMYYIGHKALPDIPAIHIEKMKNPNYIVEVEINEHFPWMGRSIQEAGLRHLNTCYVMAILRQGDCLFPVTPNQEIEYGDRLLFVGETSSSVEIEQIKGLTMKVSRHGLMEHHKDLRLVEATVPKHSSHVSSRINQINFRTKYGGIVIAVYRNGIRINEKIGSIRLKPGDMLVILTSGDLFHTDPTSRNLLILTTHSAKVDINIRDWIPLILFGIMLIVVTLGFVQVTDAALTTAVVFLLLRLTTFNEAIAAIKWDILVVIGGAFGIATAIMKSGAAELVVNQTFSRFEVVSPILLLIITYLVTNILTELITNNAAVVIIFPIILSFVNEMSLNIDPFAVAIAIAASASFSTPIGYQTNLLVYSSGQYRFSDFVKIGIPLNIMGFLISMLIIPRIWPLT